MRSPGDLPVDAPRRLLSLKAGALGDGLVAAPALWQLRQQHRAARVVWYGNPAAGNLFVAGGLVDESLPLDDLSLLPLFGPPGAPPRPPRGAGPPPWAGADGAIIWLSARGEGETVAANLRAALAADHRADPTRNQPGPPRKPSGSGLAAERHADPAGNALGKPGRAAPTPVGGRRPLPGRVTRLDPLPPTPDVSVVDWLVHTLVAGGWLVEQLAPWPPRLLSPRPEAVRDLRPWLADRNLEQQPYVVLHPGSGGTAKRWPVEGFAALARRLGDRAGVVVAGGEADEPLVQVLVEAAPGAVALPPGPLDRFAALVAGAAAYVGNDSGPTHLAALLGVPTVALFGPSDPRLWRPWGRVRVCCPGERQGDAWRWSSDPAPVLAALAAVAPMIASAPRRER